MPRRLAEAAAAAAVLYALANLAWSIGGEPLGAPPNFETVTQRSLLASTGLLAAAAAWAVLALSDPRPLGRSPDRVLAPLTVAWLGSASCFASGIAQHALARDTPGPLTSMVLALGILSGLAMAATALLAITTDADGTPSAGDTDRRGRFRGIDRRTGASSNRAGAL